MPLPGTPAGAAPEAITALAVLAESFHLVTPGLAALGAGFARGGNEGRQLICQSGMSCTHHITGACLTFGHIIRNLVRALGERIIRKADSVAKASNSVFAAYERGFVIRYCAA